MCSITSGVDAALAAAAVPGADAIGALATVPLEGLTREQLCELYAALRVQSGWLSALSNTVLCALADTCAAERSGALDPDLPANLTTIVELSDHQ